MHSIIIQLPLKNKLLTPRRALLRKWAKKALNNHPTSVEVTIRIVDIQEMTELNTAWRHRPGPTNVLSFPCYLPENLFVTSPILGDIVICAEIVDREAREQNKPSEAHWAHMIIHGIFHLMGYNHETESDALIMEPLEIKTMQSLGFANPYKTGEHPPYE